MSIEAHEIDEFVNINRANSVGRLCVLVFVSNRLRAASYPFSLQPLLTENGGQISGLNGQSVQKILRNCGADIPLSLLGEAGRTNRGSVRSAQQLIDFLNARLGPQGSPNGALQFIEHAFAARIASLLDEKGRIYRTLPTNDPNHGGPRFEIRDNKFAIEAGRTAGDGADYAAVGKLTRELRRMVLGLQDSFSTAHNCYQKLKPLISKYLNEIERENAELDITRVYFLGLEIEAQIDAVDAPDSEDPPFNPERSASLRAFRIAHGTLVALTPEGKAYLQAGAEYRGAQVDIATFREHSTHLVLQAKQEGLLEGASADTISEINAFAGKGQAPERSSFLAVVTSQNLWSNVIAKILTDYVVPEAGALLLLAITFIKTHATEFLALAESAAAYFRWLVDALKWLLGVG
ncbi:DUF4928 family protein [Methylocystis suflitae]|uniref:DUF4928 family protein n=1 Tax=Methylocystis suflitae TaxID=2951405 RepID=UPI00210CB24C|nr:DUF4928 family protein [Methylocystis suflitae]MCQ4189103.1 DUF4928 family protein [Methylocystis suflitae]